MDFPKQRREAAAWTVAGPVCFIASWVIAGLLRDDYDIRRHAISRLAEHDAPYRWIVLTGIVIVSATSMLLGLLIARQWRTRVTAVLTFVAGATAFALAIFPCSSGCPGFGTGEFTDTMHSIFAVAHYISFGLAPIAAGIETSRVATVPYRSVSVVLGLIAGGFLFSQFSGWGGQRDNPANGPHTPRHLDDHHRLLPGERQSPTTGLTP